MREMQRLLAAALRTETRTIESEVSASQGDRARHYSATRGPQFRALSSVSHLALAVQEEPGRGLGWGFLLVPSIGIGLLFALLSDRIDLYWNAVITLDWSLIGELIWVLIWSLALFIFVIQVLLPRSQMRHYLADLAQENFNLFWIFVVVCLILFHIVIFTFPIRPLTQMWATTILWGLFIGSSILFLLHSNLVITFFGFILGVGGSEIDSGVGLITRVRMGVSEIAVQVVDIAIELGAESDRHILLMVWVFFFIVWALCVPAFFRSGVESLAKNLEKKEDS